MKITPLFARAGLLFLSPYYTNSAHTFTNQARHNKNFSTLLPYFFQYKRFYNRAARVASFIVAHPWCYKAVDTGRAGIFQQKSCWRAELMRCVAFKFIEREVQILFSFPTDTWRVIKSSGRSSWAHMLWRVLEKEGEFSEKGRRELFSLVLGSTLH